jgi:hypothetical protein
MVKSNTQYGQTTRTSLLDGTNAGKTGPKAECLAYIKEVWTDMRPLSLRKKMEELAKNSPPQPPRADPNAPREKTWSNA